MDRRKFLTKTAALLSVPIFIRGQMLQVWADNAIPGVNTNGKKLVLIQLDGGNDGLNTLIPTEYYDNLANARSNILIPEDKILKITDKQGLHPALSEVANLFIEEKMMFIQSVGYPKPNLSHFRSKEIIHSASDSSVVISSGWLGRWLEYMHPDFPDQYPNENFPHPLAITIGSTSLPTCQGDLNNMGMVLKSINSKYATDNSHTSFPDTPYGYELSWIVHLMESTEKYLEVVAETAKNTSILSSKWPAADSNSLADKLKTVANLIGGGLSTPVYMVNMGGFDTHSAQVDPNAKEQGEHASLLNKLSQAIGAFTDELILQGKEEDVIGLVFSEFGRRIASNNSYGTDHGEAFPMFIFGQPVNPVVYGPNPVINDKTGKDENVKMQTDFRSVYASVLEQWFELDKNEIKDILFKDFDTFPILKSAVKNKLLLKDSATSEIITISPNPVSDYAEIRIRSRKGQNVLTLISSEGKEIMKLGGGIAGSEAVIPFYRGNLPSGSYYFVVYNSNTRFSTPVILK